MADLGSTIVAGAAALFSSIFDPTSPDIHKQMETAAETTVIADLAGFSLSGGEGSGFSPSGSKLGAKAAKSFLNALNSLNAQFQENADESLSVKGSPRPTVRGGSTTSEDETQDNRPHTFSTENKLAALISQRAESFLRSASFNPSQGIDKSFSHENRVLSSGGPTNDYAFNVNPRVMGDDKKETMKWLEEAIENYKKHVNSIKDTKLNSQSKGNNAQQLENNDRHPVNNAQQQRVENNEQQSLVNNGQQQLVENNEQQSLVNNAQEIANNDQQNLLNNAQEIDNNDQHLVNNAPPPRRSQAYIEADLNPRARQAVAARSTEVFNQLVSIGIEIPSKGDIGKLISKAYLETPQTERVGFIRAFKESVDAGIEKVFKIEGSKIEGIENLYSQLISTLYPMYPAYGKNYDELNYGEKKLTDKALAFVKGGFLSHFLQGKKIAIPGLLEDAREKVIAAEFTRTVAEFSTALDVPLTNADRDITGLFTLAKEASYIIDHASEDRKKIMDQLKAAFVVYTDNHADFTLPIYEKLKNEIKEIKFDIPGAFETVLPKIFELAQHMAIDPASHIAPSVALAEQEEIDDTRLALLLKAYIARNAQADPDDDELNLFAEIKSAFYEKFERALLEIPETTLTNDFFADEEALNRKLEELIDLSESDFQNQLDTALKMAASGLNIRSLNVTGHQFLENMFKAEISNNTGYARSANLIRGLLRQEQLTSSDYFNNLRSATDDIQYEDFNDRSKTIAATIGIASAHRIIATRQAIKIERPKFRRTVATKIDAPAVPAPSGALALQNFFGGSLVDSQVVNFQPQERDVNSLKAQLETYGIKASSQLLNNLLQFKSERAPKLLSAFARILVEQIDQSLGMAGGNAGDISLSIFRDVGIHAPEASIVHEFQQELTHYLRNEALSLILKNKAPVVFNSSRVEVVKTILFSVLDKGLKAASKIDSDLAINFHNIIMKNSAIAGTKQQKQSLLINVLYKLIKNYEDDNLKDHAIDEKLYRLPKALGGSLDNDAFFNMLVPEINSGFVELGLGTRGPLQLIEMEEPDDLNISPILPAIGAHIYNALITLDLGTGENVFTELANLKPAMLLKKGMTGLLGTLFEGHKLTDGVMNHMIHYLQSRMDALNSELLSKLKVGKRLEQLNSPLEIWDELQRFQRPTNTKIVPEVDIIDAPFGGPPPPPPPAPPAPGGPGITVTHVVNYSIFKDGIALPIIDPTAGGAGGNPLVNLNEGDLALSLPFLWKESKKMREATRKELENQEKQLQAFLEMGPRFQKFLQQNFEGLEILTELEEETDPTALTSDNPFGNTKRLESPKSIEQRMEDMRRQREEDAKRKSWAETTPRLLVPKNRDKGKEKED